MKLFLSKLMAFSTITLVIMFLLSELYNYITLPKNSNYYDETKFLHVPYNIQVSNFGSSHGLYGFDYKNHLSKYTAFNFALSSQTLSYDYLILKQYEDHFSNGGIMFILVSNFSFGNDEESQPDFRSKNQRYYSFLTPKYIKKFDWKYYYLKPFFLGSNVVLTTIKNKVKEVINPNKKSNEDLYELGGINFNYEKDAEAAYKRHIHINENEDLIVLEEEVNALYGIINICKKHKIRPVLLTTPYRKEYNNKFSDKFYKQFHNVINEICKKTGTEYYDYSHDARFVSSVEYNRNADHLTPLGAIAFTDILFKDLID